MTRIAILKIPSNFHVLMISKIWLNKFKKSGIFKENPVERHEVSVHELSVLSTLSIQFLFQ
jgi:hypothetical protein